MKKTGSFREFKKTMKSLTWEERIDHIWTYYKLELFLILLIPIVIAGLITWYQNSQIETIFSGNITNLDITNEGYTYLVRGYGETLGADEETQIVELSFADTLGLDIANANDVGVDEGVRVAAMVAAGTLDYIITDRVGLEYYAVQGAFEPLPNVLSAQQLAGYAQWIYYHTDAETGESYPVAININSLPFVKECVENDSAVYIGFPINSAHAEQMDDFFAYLCNWQGRQKEQP